MLSFALGRVGELLHDENFLQAVAKSQDFMVPFIKRGMVAKGDETSGPQPQISIQAAHQLHSHAYCGRFSQQEKVDLKCSTEGDAGWILTHIKCTVCDGILFSDP